MSPNPKEKESLLSSLIEIIENNLANEQFGVNELAREMGMSRSNLHRKVKTITGASISKLICRIKVERARELLLESSSTIAEIAFETGFHSVTYFTKCYKDHFGYPPGEERKPVSDMSGVEGLLEQKAKQGIRKRIPAMYFYASIFVLMLVLFMLIKPKWDREAPYDKSIAVLPFINDSPDESEMYFINATMEAILNNLGKIEDLRVVSRTSVEQYRNNPRPIKQVAKEMNVSYIIEGSGIKQDDEIWLSVVLIDAINDSQIWSESYHKEYAEVIELYSQVAQSIAAEIDVAITPEERRLIKKIPTTNQTAYDLYQRGNEEYLLFPGGGHLNMNMAALERAEDIFRLALEYDTTFAELYANMASIYNTKYTFEKDPSPSYLDSISLYIDKAFYHDDQLAKAYTERGLYYELIGEREKAINDYRNSLELAPNNSRTLYSLAWSYNNVCDTKSALESLHKKELIDRGLALIETLRDLQNTYLFAGCYEQSLHYARKGLQINGDSSAYLTAHALCEYFINNNTSKAIDLLNRAYAIDPEDAGVLSLLAQVYFGLGNYAESLYYIEKRAEILQATNQVDHYQAFLVGFIYLKNGNRSKADHYFDLQIRSCEMLLARNFTMSGQLAMAYAGKGEKEKAFESLRHLNQMDRLQVYVLRNLEDDSFFESIQDDPEFQKIKKELIAKYQSEHKRVTNWLEENGML